MVLTLRIKKQYFDAIASGKKTVEYRDVTPFYDSRIANFDRQGKMVSYKPITEVLLINGYQKDAPRLRVQVKEIKLLEKLGDFEYPMLDEDGEVIPQYAIYLGRVMGKG